MLALRQVVVPQKVLELVNLIGMNGDNTGAGGTGVGAGFIVGPGVGV